MYSKEFILRPDSQITISYYNENVSHTTLKELLNDESNRIRFSP